MEHRSSSIKKTRKNVVIFAVFLLFLLFKLPCMVSGAITPDVDWAIFDADYGSYTEGDGDINDDGYTTESRIMGSGKVWDHFSYDTLDGYPYNGPYMYKSRCTESTEDKDRTEHRILGDWEFADGTRYMSFAFYVPRITEMHEDNWFWLAQLHQGNPNTIGLGPPLLLSCNDGLTFARKYYIPPDYTHDVRTVIYNDGPLVYDQWYHFLVQAKPGCWGNGMIKIWKMDLATGKWGLKCDLPNIAVGFPYNESGNPVSQTDYNYKVGTYREGVDEITRVHYDNIRYAKTWQIITDNKLIGYHKKVLYLAFDEGSGTTANDESWCTPWGNGDTAPGDPTTDYDNDGTLLHFASTCWKNSDIKGKCLLFDGYNDYVRVPLDTVDFDFGNYVTFACWFKASTDQAGKALMSMDLDSGGANVWKTRLWFSADAANKLDFCVRYSDGTTDTVRASNGTPFCDNLWHYVVGTYNRFASDGYRLTIYVDGEWYNQAEGADKPILRGTQNFYVGRIYDSYYSGYIDEVMVCNYAMTEEEVYDLYVDYYNYQ